MDTKISRSIYSHEYVHGFIGHLGAYQQVWFTIHYFESQEPGAKQAEHQIHTRSERSWASSVCVSLTIHFKIKWNKHVLLKWGDNMEASFEDFEEAEGIFKPNSVGRQVNPWQVWNFVCILCKWNRAISVYKCQYLSGGVEVWASGQQIER